MKKLLWILLTLFLIVSCSNNNKIYTGHYHYLEEDGCYHTVTITDSSVFVDEFTIGAGYEYLFSEYVHNDTVFVPPVGFFVNSESKIYDVFEPEKWIKVEPTEEDFIHDLCCNLFVEFIPEETDDDSDDDIDPNYGQLFIGKPKPQFKDKFQDEGLFTMEGYYVEYNGNIVTKEELHHELFFYNTDLLIIADRDCPEELLSEIIGYHDPFSNGTFKAFLAKVNPAKRKLLKKRCLIPGNYPYELPPFE